MMTLFHQADPTNRVHLISTGERCNTRTTINQVIVGTEEPVFKSVYTHNSISNECLTQAATF